MCKRAAACGPLPFWPWPGAFIVVEVLCMPFTLAACSFRCDAGRNSRPHFLVQNRYAAELLAGGFAVAIANAERVGSIWEAHHHCT
jgi:hypothetical protein